MAIELADKLYTSTQVADILGVSLRTLYRYMEDDKIKSMRTASGRHRFTKDHIIEFLNAGRSDSDMGGMSSNVGGPALGNPAQSQTSSFAGEPQNQSFEQRPQTPSYADNAQVATNDTPQGVQSTQGFSGIGQSAQQGVGAYQNQPQENPVTNNDQATEENSDDDFEFDITNYDYDNVGSDSNDQQVSPQQKEDDLYEESFAQSNQQQREAQPAEQAQNASGGQSASTFAPPASTAASSAQTGATQLQGVQQQQAQVDQSQPESRPVSENALNVRYYKSDYSDLIELAKKVKDASNSKDLEYAFTVYAGLSLHFLIKPFTILHIYANPEDMQLWKDELRLVPTQNKDEANLGVIINTDIVFVPTKEIGGFKVVEDKVLLKDLSASNEEGLVKEFRQHLIDS